ncbi:hypothetical protein BaRGS_00026908, partial [Batillaria attramentaria]
MSPTDLLCSPTSNEESGTRQDKQVGRLPMQEPSEYEHEVGLVNGYMYTATASATAVTSVRKAPRDERQDPKETPPPTRVETRDERKERKRTGSQGPDHPRRREQRVYRVFLFTTDGSIGLSVGADLTCRGHARLHWSVRRKERQEQHAYKLEQDLALFLLVCRVKVGWKPNPARVKVLIVT